MSTIARLTLAEFDRMIEQQVFDPARERRIELIYGELREMNPPGATHEEVVDLLTRWSFDNVSRKKVRVRIQNSVGIEALDSVPLPDVVWVKERSYRKRRPQPDDVYLLIEVSESSLADDRREKAELYASAGIADYWIVNLRDSCLEVYRKPTEGEYRDKRSYEMGESVSPLAFPRLSLEVSSLFV
jgi:Uma2 family endonuclease